MANGLGGHNRDLADLRIYWILFFRGEQIWRNSTRYKNEEATLSQSGFGNKIKKINSIT
jgi:hypothetical protein